MGTFFDDDKDTKKEPSTSGLFASSVAAGMQIAKEEDKEREEKEKKEDDGKDT